MKWLALCACLMLWGPVTQAGETRVVALSWESAEHLLKLDIEPIAIADAKDYRAWVVRPTLPDEVVDAGSRTEPNLELLADLAPDLIVIPPMLEDMRATLERVAPVQTYSSFTRDSDNYQMQRDNYLALARHLGREDLAHARLEEMDLHLSDMRRRLFEHFAGTLPKVSVIRFSSPTVVYINGKNSMVQRAMDLLHLKPAYPQPASEWGITQTSVTTLGNIKEGVVLHIEPFSQQDILFAAPLWRAMPFVKTGLFGSLPSTWTYGGVFSVEYLAESITNALLEITPEQALASSRP
jgi:iron complex transport system substrate-binding protein